MPHRSPIDRLLDRLWRVAWIASVAVVGLTLAVWALDREPPTRIDSITLRTPVVRAGGELRLDYRIERRSAPCPVSIQRVIVDSQQVIHLLASYSYDRPDESPALDAPAGQRVARLGPVTRVAAPVPIGAAPGAAQYQAIITYYCNPLQRLLNWPVRVETPVQVFEILPGEESRGGKPASRIALSGAGTVATLAPWAVLPAVRGAGVALARDEGALW